MNKIMRSLLDPYIYIMVDFDKKEVTEVAYRCSGKPFLIVERTDDSFEEILYKALAALSIKSAIELKEFTKNDEKLKKAFVMLYKRKQRMADIYKIDDDNWKNSSCPKKMQLLQKRKEDVRNTSSFLFTILMIQTINSI